MAYPTDVGIIDLMLNIPGADNSQWYEFMKPLFLDEESRRVFEMPAQYMFKNIDAIGPAAGTEVDYVAYTLGEMDRFGIEKALVGVSGPAEGNADAVRRFPDRFIASYQANPNLGMEGVRAIERVHREIGLACVTGFPSGLCPQVPINDKRWYPVYAKCVELDLPIAMCVGVPGPRLPMAPQKVELIDEVCWFFPELTFIMRHGAEPWTDLAVKLMLKYPNLYYSTSAFAPRYYPKAIIDFANTRGADKIMYAGYFPMGLSLERIFSEMPSVPFRDHVWPKFLSGNARRVLKLDRNDSAATAETGSGDTADT